MSGPTSRKRNRAVSLAAKDGGDEAPPMSALAAQHASEQLLVAAMGSARFSAAEVEAAEVAKLVAEGGPLDELINIALVQSNKHAVREGGAIPLIVGLLREDGGLVPSAAAWPSLRATTVVSALWSLAAHTPLNQDAIRLAGGVPRLPSFRPLSSASDLISEPARSRPISTTRPRLSSTSVPAWPGASRCVRRAQ